MFVRPDVDPLASQNVEWVVDRHGRTWQLGSRGYLASLFIPLPTPLLVEDGFSRAWVDNLDPFDDQYLRDLIDDVEFQARKSMSMCVRRVQIDFRSRSAEMIDAAAQMAFPGLPEPAPVPMSPAAASVVEVTGPVRSRSTDDLSTFVDAAIDGVRRFQQAYGAATGKSHRLVSRQTLPAVTPVFLRSPADDVAAVQPDGVLMMMHHRVPLLDEFADDVSEETIEQIDGLVAQIELGAPFMTAGLRLAEALRWTDAEGESWPAIALLGTACEVMLDELLCTLLWESGHRPEDCSKYLVAAITRRVNDGPLGELLPGDWEVNGSGRIAAWNRDVARLRNEAMHLGRPPSAEELARARSAAIGLRDEIRFRVLAEIKRYPRTAWMLFGENSLPAELRQKHVAPLYNRDDEIDWKRAASAWRRVAVYNTRFGRWADVKANRADLELVAVAHPDGHVSWVVADTSCERAMLLSAPPAWLPKQQRDVLKGPTSQAVAAGSPISSFMQVSGPLPTVGEWRAWYRVLPNQELMLTEIPLER